MSLISAKSTRSIFMKFGKFVQNNKCKKLLTFGKPESKFNIKTLKIFKSK